VTEELASPIPTPITSIPQIVPGIESRSISGFWRRWGAFILDLLILFLVLAYPAYRWFRFFSLHPRWSLLIGFAISFIYFVILNSEMGGGQTVGKKTLRIHLVDIRGESIPVSRSILRFLVLATPFYAEKLQFTCSGSNCWLTTIMSWTFAAWETIIIYLYIFNLRTRQSLHDLAAGTYVIEASSRAAKRAQSALTPETPAPDSTPAYVTSEQLWGGHWIILGAVFIVAIVLDVTVWPKLLNVTPYSELAQIQQAVQLSGKVRQVSLKMTIGNLNGGKTPRHLGVSFVPTDNSGDDKKLATEIASIVLHANPKPSEVDFLDIAVLRVADFGLLHYSSSRTFSHTPDEWKHIVLSSGAGTGSSAWLKFGAREFVSTSLSAARL
jgi:uncharacterized RDD family membrane protein YckC